AQWQQLPHLDPVGMDDDAAHLLPQHRGDRAPEEDDPADARGDDAMAVPYDDVLKQARVRGRHLAVDDQRPHDDREEQKAERWQALSKRGTESDGALRAVRHVEARRSRLPRHAPVYTPAGGPLGASALFQWSRVSLRPICTGRPWWACCESAPGTKVSWRR